MKRTHAWAALAVIGSLVLGACGDDEDTATSDSVTGPLTVTVSAANFPESQLLAEIYALALERADIRVARKDPIGAREAYYAAIKAGEVSLIPEYTGSLLSYIENTEGVDATVPPVDTSLTGDTTTADPAATGDTATGDTATGDTATGDTATGDTATGDTATGDTATGDTTAPAEQGGPTIEQQVAMIKSVLPANLTVGNASTAEDKDVIVCSPAVAEELELRTLSDLAEAADQIKLGAPPEFETRTPFGLVGFREILGAEFEEFVPLQIGAIADSIESGAIDCGNLFSTMSVILTDNLIPLEDDRTLVAHEAVLPLLTTEAATPEVLAVLDEVSAGLTTDILKSLMVKVEVDAVAPDQVARDYLESLAQGG